MLIQFMNKMFKNVLHSFEQLQTSNLRQLYITI
jgi:hypothetical protein